MKIGDILINERNWSLWKIFFPFNLKRLFRSRSVSESNHNFKFSFLIPFLVKIYGIRKLLNPRIFRQVPD